MPRNEIVFLPSALLPVLTPCQKVTPPGATPRCESLDAALLRKSFDLHYFHGKILRGIAFPTRLSSQRLIFLLPQQCSVEKKVVINHSLVGLLPKHNTIHMRIISARPGGHTRTRPERVFSLPPASPETNVTKTFFEFDHSSMHAVTEKKNTTPWIGLHAEDALMPNFAGCFRRGGGTSRRDSVLKGACCCSHDL